jgi:hypothetical protein
MAGWNPYPGSRSFARVQRFDQEESPWKASEAQIQSSRKVTSRGQYTAVPGVLCDIRIERSAVGRPGDRAHVSS